MYFRRYADAKNCNEHAIKFGIHKVLVYASINWKLLLIISIYEFLNLSELIQGFNAWE